MKVERLDPEILGQLGYHVRKRPNLPRAIGRGESPSKIRERELRDALHDEKQRADAAERQVRTLRAEVERLKRFVRELQS